MAVQLVDRFCPAIARLDNHNLLARIAPDGLYSTKKATLSKKHDFSHQFALATEQLQFLSCSLFLYSGIVGNEIYW